MSETTGLKDRTWPADQVLTMACAVYRLKGYTSASTFVSSDPQSDIRWNSKEHLCYQLVPEIVDKDYRVLINVTQEDVDTANAIVQHYRKLTFGVIADNLNVYMQRVFSSTQKGEVKFNDFGVLASVPITYQNEVAKKRILKEAKDAKQEYISEVGKTVELTVRYINTQFIQNLNCYAHNAITDTNYLVTFLNKVELAKSGQTQRIRAKIKTHGVNFQTKTIETQLNYVKVLDNEFIWQ